MKKRSLALFLVLTLLLVMAPGARAADTAATYYVDQQGVCLQTAGTYVISQTDPGTPTANTITIGTPGAGGRFYVTLRNINIDASQTTDGAAVNISAGAQVTITLEGHNYVKSSSDRAGIQTSDLSTALTIRGGGSLEARGGDHAAGIGAALDAPCGTITIEGGKIDAYGGIGAAGIGGGDALAAGKPTGTTGGAHTINISGGTIYAEGTENPDETDDYSTLGAAGIGAGYWGGNTTIHISGGDITALGVAKAPCIGTDTLAWITISGGTIHTARNPGDSIQGAQEIGGYDILAGASVVSAEPGNSIVYVSGAEKITNWSGSAWRGIVWEGASGTVYGPTDLTGKELTIAAGETLTVPGSTEGEEPAPTLMISEAGFHNDGTITGPGTVQMDGENYRIQNNQLVLIRKVIAQDTLTITGQPTDTIHCGDTFRLDTSGGSGEGAVTWSAAGAATVGQSTGEVTVTGAGSAAITATKAEDDNYADATATYTFTSEKAVPDVGTVSCSDAIHPGTDPASVTLTHTGTADGTLKLAEGTAFTLGTRDYDWTFIPADTENYTAAAGKISLTVTQAALSGIAVTTPPAKTAYTFGEAFDSTGMVVTATYADGTAAAVTPAFETALTAGQTTLVLSYTEGSVTKTCTLSGLTVNTTGGAGPEPAPDPGTGSGGVTYPTGGSTTTETTTNSDGSTTTKTENKTTGTVTETTKNPDGSQVKVETKKDGTVTTTETDTTGNKAETVAKPDGSSMTKVEQVNGTTATVTTDIEGKVEAEVALSRQLVNAAQAGGSTVPLPIPAVQPAAASEAAPVVTVKTGSEEPVKVLIPTTEANPGTVAVLLKADGTEEIVKTSVPTADGLAVSLPDGATVKIVDNSRSFDDVPANSWAADAVSFSAARELFSGTPGDTFSPDEPMTRAMMVTVLARFDGADTSGGSTWYEQGVAWAVANGISDGSSPGGSVSREQLAVMLWRYAGSPAPAGGLDEFHDAGSVSGYAQDAMRWAVENGIISGNGSGTLLPQGEATRAQVAQMLMNFISAR